MDASGSGLGSRRGGCWQLSGETDVLQVSHLGDASKVEDGWLACFQYNNQRQVGDDEALGSFRGSLFSTQKRYQVCG